MKKKKKRRQRLCCICKKRPVWVGGDVKNPGHVCKRCCHAHVWPERPAAARQEPPLDDPEESWRSWPALRNGTEPTARRSGSRTVGNARQTHRPW